MDLDPSFKMTPAAACPGDALTLNLPSPADLRGVSAARLGVVEMTTTDGLASVRLWVSIPELEEMLAQAKRILATAV
jgi:hypothetical protein